MFLLERIRDAWGDEDIATVAKHEIEQIAPEQLPLQQGLTQSSYVKDEPFTVSVLNAEDDATCIRITAGVFYKGLIPGCSCADDPTPMDDYNEYCELCFYIDKQTAETTVMLV